MMAVTSAGEDTHRYSWTEDEASQDDARQMDDEAGDELEKVWGDAESRLLRVFRL